MNKEDFELHPHYPPPHKDGAYPRYWPYWPQWPAGWHGWNDTEPASVGPWGCCPPPHPDDCVCVTQQDIDNWNNISAVSALSGLDLSPLSSISGMDLPYSATLWNSCYETVYENSAMWNGISGLPELSGYVSAFSAWTVDKIEELSAHENKVIVDYDDSPYSLVGDGSSENPLSFNSTVTQLLYYLDNGVPMYTIENKKYGGKPSIPKVEWFAKTSAVNSLQESYTNLLEETSRQKAAIVELWQSIELILNIITDKYKDNADIAEQLKLLNQKITNYYFVENDKQPNNG